MQTIQTATALTLRQQLLAEGFRPGPPPQVRRVTLTIDAAIARRMRCPDCDHRGLTAKPHHCGNAYRVLARCDRCGNEVEL